MTKTVRLLSFFLSLKFHSVACQHRTQVGRRQPGQGRAQLFERAIAKAEKDPTSLSQDGDRGAQDWDEVRQKLANIKRAMDVAFGVPSGTRNVVVKKHA
ncbi:hypothetical protein BGZ59_010432 [Podila verticillata]|nr:hypothetical protein BGZ59_010432 [Podila verticillata]